MTTVGDSSFAFVGVDSDDRARPLVHEVVDCADLQQQTHVHALMGRQHAAQMACLVDTGRRQDLVRDSASRPGLLAPTLVRWSSVASLREDHKDVEALNVSQCALGDAAGDVSPEDTDDVVIGDLFVLELCSR